MLEARILFVDADAIVIDKPAGLPVDTPRNGGDSIERRLDELKLGFKRPPVAMHRLDQDTSGCLLLARNGRAVRVFQHAIEAGRMEKLYLAALDGIPDGTEGEIDLPLAKFSTAQAGWRMVPDEAGKRAVTRWRLLGTRDGQSLVEFRPATGRTHQIRVHAARGLKAPVIGDPVYAEAGDAPEQMMLLHSWSLSVPRTDKPPVFARARVPDHFGLWLDFIDEP